ncbi:MAG: glycosyltransferase [Lentisphaerae bacterium]|nr:glycosyltransferase [Lentisphaerota bacterium]
MKPIQVLHSIGSFLEISENWIYPQVTAVSGVIGAVVTRRATNQDVFPLAADRLVLYRSPWERTFRGRRLLEPLERRVVARRIASHVALRSWNPDILHAHIGTQGWLSLDLQQKLEVPLVTSFYGADAWLLPERVRCWRDRYRRLFAEGDLFLVEGPAMRARLTDLGCPEGKIVIQRIGAAVDTLPWIRKTFWDGLNIVMVGRFVEKKGLIDGLRACALARAQGAELHVTIVGDAKDGDATGERLKAEMQACAAESALAGRVHFMGFIPLDQIHGVVAAHNLFLCPSKHASDGDAEGGSPVILTEAMAAGLLCVGTRHCDIPELILDGTTGWLCAEGDVDHMARILVNASQQLEEGIRLTEAGRRHVEDHFSVDRQMDQLRGVYDSVLSIA